MSAIRRNRPAAGEQPGWSEHWNQVRYEWELAAREVCQLADQVQTAAETYLAWKAGDPQGTEDPWWYSELDWSRFAEDVNEGRTGLSSAEKALARVAAGLAQGRGEIEYQALLSAGFLDRVIAIVKRCADDIDANGTRA